MDANAPAANQIVVTAAVAPSATRKRISNTNHIIAIGFIEIPRDYTVNSRFGGLPPKKG
jgi:hypothetical protein